MILKFKHFFEFDLIFRHLPQKEFRNQLDVRLECQFDLKRDLNWLFSLEDFVSLNFSDGKDLMVFRINVDSKNESNTLSLVSIELILSDDCSAELAAE